MTDCTAPRHEAAPEPAAPHAFLCRPCSSGLRRDLHRLPALHAELASILDAPAILAGMAAGRQDRAGDGSAPLPFHVPASLCRDQIAHDVLWWTAEVITERQPDPWPALTLPAMCGWLAGQAEWISFRPWAGDMAGAVASDAGWARAILDPLPVKFIHMSRPCPQCRSRELTMAAYSEADRRSSVITCGGCGCKWDFGPEWIELGRDILRHHDETKTAA